MRPIDETEIVSSYEIRAVCGDDVEARIRSVLIAAVRETRMSLIAMHSEDGSSAGRTDVTADVTAAGRGDARLEKIVIRVGREQGVFAIRWKTVRPTMRNVR